MVKKTKSLSLNFGPQHPAAHGVLRLILELDGFVVLIVIVRLVLDGTIPKLSFLLNRVGSNVVDVV